MDLLGADLLAFVKPGTILHAYFLMCAHVLYSDYKTSRVSIAGLALFIYLLDFLFFWYLRPT